MYSSSYNSQIDNDHRDHRKDQRYRQHITHAHAGLTRARLPFDYHATSPSLQYLKVTHERQLGSIEKMNIWVYPLPELAEQTELNERLKI